VELEDAISSEERPVTAPGQHLSAEPRTLEVTARDWGSHAGAEGYGADPLYAADGNLQRHQQAEIQLATSAACLPFSCVIAHHGEVAAGSFDHKDRASPHRRQQYGPHHRRCRVGHTLSRSAHAHQMAGAA